jgi:hypothetical protein
MEAKKGSIITGGKVSILTVVLGVLVLLFGVFGELPHGNVARAAQNATTSVTVLNTPPQWDTTVYAYESTASASTTPTNAGSVITWVASSSDSSNDNYYLLICSNYASPTPNSGAAPTCSGGAANRLAGSGATASGVMATAATTTQAYQSEINYWYAYICDGAASNPSCNISAWNGSTTPILDNVPAHSPFIVNHRPTFTLFVNYAGTYPGATSTWYSTSSDPDTLGGFATDTVTLLVCRAADFSGTTCGIGGSWGTSTSVVADATTTYHLANPYPKGYFGGYGYVFDSRSFVASGGSQGTNASLIVLNATPTISAASISLFSSTGTAPLVLTNMATQTLGYSVQYTVTDQNSCQTASNTAEIISGHINVYRSGYGSTSCNVVGNHNPNYCYNDDMPSSVWNVSCVGGACAGSSSANVVWTCTFPLWYLADATDPGSVYASENWLAVASSTDTSGATSTLVEASTGTELWQFMAFDLSTTTIAYGGLQPGQDTGTVGPTAYTQVGLLAQGNVGLDESLYGVDMCPGYPAPCSGNATSTIPVASQRYASSSVSYLFATSSLSAVSTDFLLHVTKTTATATPNQLSTYWGIAIPAAITLSGDYLGQNTIIGKTSPSASW